MSDLVTFSCPKHGPRLETVPTARVECGKCGEECAPAGSTPAEQRRRWATRKRVARHRERPTAKALQAVRETAGQRVEASAMSPLSKNVGADGAEAS